MSIIIVLFSFSAMSYLQFTISHSAIFFLIFSHFLCYPLDTHQFTFCFSCLSFVLTAYPAHLHFCHFINSMISLGQLLYGSMLTFLDLLSLVLLFSLIFIHFRVCFQDVLLISSCFVTMHHSWHYSFVTCFALANFFSLYFYFH